MKRTLTAIAASLSLLGVLPSCVRTHDDLKAKARTPNAQSTCTDRGGEANRADSFDEGELRARWPKQLADVWFVAPLPSARRADYVRSGMPFPPYLWTEGQIDAQCAPAYLAWTGDGRADGYFVAAHWVEDGRQYREVFQLHLADGVLTATTGYEVQVLDEDLFWSPDSTVAYGDGGYRVLGVFSERKNGVSIFDGVPARVHFLCEQGDCSECKLSLYVAQLRELPAPWESPGRDSAPGVHPDVWTRNCKRRLSSHDSLVIETTEKSKAWQLRTDRRPTALYPSKARCQQDARSPDLNDRMIVPLPKFARVRVKHYSGTPRGTGRSSKQRFLTAEQTVALLFLFSEKEVFTGASGVHEGTFDVVSFELLDSAGSSVANGSAHVSSDCSSAAHSYLAPQELSELGRARCQQLLKLVGPLELEFFVR
jgi:hypothetical protein